MNEGQKHWACAAIVPSLYAATTNRRIRALLRRLTLRFEGGPMYSLTVRDIYRKYHHLDVGLYTIGPCEAGPDNLAAGTSIGRYSSIYYTVRTMCGDGRLIIGNDVYIGHNAIILPTVERIGDGAFIGAGSVVHTSVPAYAVFIGNPARAVKYRFSKKTIADLLESTWWEKSLVELSREFETFQVPLGGDEYGPTKSDVRPGAPAVRTAV
jgi:virginiamycin A acetyltransferase